ncbi:hypothetical protein [Oscillatoria nigro-viridis]|nr:hypothetical protein [Oscillatoria nigro-viridis]
MTLYSTIARSGVSAATKGDRTIKLYSAIAFKGVTINSQICDSKQPNL